MKRSMQRMRTDEGFTLVEVVIAMALITVGFLVLAGATSSGARLLVQSKQRQAATQQANAAIEHIRNVAYDNAMLSTQPSHAADEDSPDFYVNEDGTEYDHAHGGDGEQLVVDSVHGLVLHTEDVSTGSTSMTLYQYVTWVDDPNISGSQDYKRVSVVVSYLAGANPGRLHTVEASTLLTTGTITVGGTTSSAGAGSSSSPTPSPTPTPSGPCGADTVGPTGTFSILSSSGAQTGYTASTTASISLSPSDTCTPISVQFSNDNATYGTAFTYDSGNPNATWTLAGTDGSKNVWARYTDGAGNVSTVGPQPIALDQTLPTAAGTLTRTVSCSGNNRTVTLNWGNSTDANLVGYRIYKNANNVGYSALKTSATLTTTDTDSKILNSLSYKIVAYDKAGNEGTATNVISLAKNKCS